MNTDTLLKRLRDFERGDWRSDTVNDICREAADFIEYWRKCSDDNERERDAAVRALTEISKIDPQVYFHNRTPCKTYRGPHAEIAIAFLRDQGLSRAASTEDSAQ